MFTKKKLKITKKKDIGPGPGSYNLPTLFGRKLYAINKSCIAQERREQKYRARYLDILVTNALKEVSTQEYPYRITDCNSYDN